METLDVLIAARAEVEKGWCKGVAVDARGNVCALGALDTVVGAEKHTRVFAMQYDDICDARDARVALINALPAAPRSVPAFNDDPQTTKADVLSLYDRAIAAEAVKGRGIKLEVPLDKDGKQRPRAMRVTAVLDDKDPKPSGLIMPIRLDV